VKAAVGFLHAGAASRDATIAALVRCGKESAATHLVDSSLVDPNAQEFPIDDKRYQAILSRAWELAAQADRIVLTCSAYNAVVPSLREDLGISVERSDAAGARALLGTKGAVGVLVSFPPTRGVVVDYLSEVFAGAEQSRDVRTVIAEAPPFSTSAEDYRAALLGALPPLRGCGVLFVSQYSMNAHLDALREAWGSGPLVSAVDEMAVALDV